MLYNLFSVLCEHGEFIILEWWTLFILLGWYCVSKYSGELWFAPDIMLICSVILVLVTRVIFGEIVPYDYIITHHYYSWISSNIMHVVHYTNYDVYNGLSQLFLII